MFGCINFNNNLALVLDSSLKSFPKNMKIFEDKNFFLANSTEIKYLNNISVGINGEIYNKELLAKKLGLEITLDIESIIIFLYLKYGINFINEINGIFTIFLFDKNKNSFFIFRDMMGIKPLFYSLNNNTLFFSSTMNWFYKNKNIDFKINRKSLNNLFDLRFIPSPNTIFTNISKLDAGQYLEINKSNIKTQYFFKPQILRSKKITEENLLDVSKEYMNLLTKAVESCIFDNNYCTFLSGGVDSATMSLLINSELLKKYNSQVNNLSVEYGISCNNINEAEEAKKICDFVGNKIIQKELKDNDILDIFNSTISTLNEPVYSSINPSTFFLSKTAKLLGFKNVVTGEGADELLFGYNYLDEAIDNNYLSCYFEKLFWINDNIRKDLLLDYNDKVFNNSYDEYFDKNNQLDSIRYFKFKQLADYDLNRVQVMASSQDLKLHLPFTHKEIVEYLLNFDTNSLLTLNKGKAILKQGIRGKIPNCIIDKKKVPFRAPVKFWLDKQLKPLVYENILNEKYCDMLGFNRKCLDKIVSNHYAGIEDHSVLLWGLLVLFSWFNNFKKIN
ncbi:MAG TPA: asparagine synthase-related protein [Rickettsiales bacterium]|nr:asparagine synthase-related protein [Rickettsiales bacterium]